LLFDDDPHAFITVIGGRRFDHFSYAIYGGLPVCAYSGRHADNFGERFLELNKFDKGVHAHSAIVAAPQDGHTGLDSRIREPGFGVAFHHGD
jgi:hypothetical protein